MPIYQDTSDIKAIAINNVHGRPDKAKSCQFPALKIMYSNNGHFVILLA